MLHARLVRHHVQNVIISICVKPVKSEKFYITKYALMIVLKEQYMMILMINATCAQTIVNNVKH